MGMSSLSKAYRIPIYDNLRARSATQFSDVANDSSEFDARVGSVERASTTQPMGTIIGPIWRLPSMSGLIAVKIRAMNGHWNQLFAALISMVCSAAWVSEAWSDVTHAPSLHIGALPLDASDEEPEQRSADESNEESLDKLSAGEDVDSEKSSKPRPVDQLLKPMAAIDLTTSPESGKSPQDETSAYLALPEYYVSANVHPRTSPTRYPICSCHNPLYFEEPNFERCGNGCGCLTPAISAAHFLSGTILLPYNMVADLPCSTMCAAGDCPCGCEMPCQRPLTCSVVASVSEAAAVAGFVFLLL